MSMGVSAAWGGGVGSHTVIDGHGYGGGCGYGDGGGGGNGNGDV